MHGRTDMTRRATDVIGKPVVAADSGKKLGTVEDLLLDDDTNEFRGLLVGHGMMRGKDVLPAGEIQSMGRDAVVSRTSALVDPKQWNRGRQEPSPRDLGERNPPDRPLTP
jgi:uncharacterized protein YrrD